MRVFLILAVTLGLASPALAQDSEQEAEEAKTYLEELLQDNLSGDDHTVTISGFRGALSSQATMQQMTVADEDGVWLTMRGATLDWSRSALLGGRLMINELSANEIIVDRAPKPQEGLTTDSAEVTAFALPDLPVSINIEKVAIEKVVLGEPVIGEALTLSTAGNVSLDEGDGQAQLEIRRLDRNDEFTLAASFSNTTRILALDLNASEDKGGLISKLIGIPGQPSLALQITGEAPVSDYTARLALSSDGQRRFGGTVRIVALSETEEVGHEFSADLSGDVRPLFAPSMHAFFGENSTLDVNGTRYSDGRLTLSALDLASGAMEVEGSLMLAAEGWPERFDLRGKIGTGDPVRLPLTGPETSVNSAEITAKYDAGEDETWITTAEVYGLTRDGLSIAGARLDAQGKIATRPLQQITANIRFDTTGMAHTDTNFAEAMGEATSGTAKINWAPNRPIELQTLEITSGNTVLTASARVSGIETGLKTEGNAKIITANLRRFAGLAGRDISGAAYASVEGTVTPLSGEFDAMIKAETADLQISEPRLDPILRGNSVLVVDADRSENGTTLRKLTIENDAVTAEASGLLQAERGQLDLVAALKNVALVEPRLSGPARAKTNFVWQKDTGITFNALEASVATATISATGTVKPDDPDLPVTGTVKLNAEDLSRFAELAGRKLAGSGEAELTGSVTGLGEIFDAVLSVDMQNLQVDEARVDPVLKGQTALFLDAERTATGGELRFLTLKTDVLSASATGALDAERGKINLSAELSDVSLVEPSLSGPAKVNGAADWAPDTGIVIEMLEAAVSGATLSANGTVKPDDPALPVEGQIKFAAENLARFATVAQRPLSGSVDLSIKGKAEVKGQTFDASGAINGSGFRTGIATVDRLIAGSITTDFSGRLGNGAPDVRYLKLATPQLRINAAGDGPGAPVAISARLADLGLFAPDFPGPATTRGTLTIRDEEGRQVGVSLDATGPGGTTARIVGDILDYGQRLALDVVGSAPMGLANRFISPQSVQGDASFDLRIDGPPGLNALSGQVSFANARAALPTLNYALNDLTGAVELAVGRVNVNVAGNAGTGGEFRVSGPVQLIPGFPGNINVALNNLGLFDPSLYQTTIGGSLDVSGYLAGGARIDGVLALGPTELRVPSGSGTISGTLPDISHFYETKPGRQTRERAGLIEAAQKSSVAYPINIVINAPSRIFVRGRGLDAELGGSLRLTGTTADVAASGVFELIRGRLDLLGKRLDLTEGLIDLRGALNPYLRFVAETSADDILIQVILEGLASEPTVTFTSSPELPQEEVVARLLFGRDLASMSAFQAAQLVSAVATLSGRYQGGITGRVRDSLGLSDLDITTTDEGATEFTAGAYISDNIYSEVTADSEGKQEINLNLDLSKSFTVKGSVNNEGNTGIGIFFEKDY